MPLVAFSRSFFYDTDIATETGPEAGPADLFVRLLPGVVCGGSALTFCRVLSASKLWMKLFFLRSSTETWFRAVQSGPAQVWTDRDS
jgi:hypothetical protein